MLHISGLSHVSVIVTGRGSCSIRVCSISTVLLTIGLALNCINLTCLLRLQLVDEAVVIVGTLGREGRRTRYLFISSHARTSPFIFSLSQLRTTLTPFRSFSLALFKRAFLQFHTVLKK